MNNKHNKQGFVPLALLVAVLIVVAGGGTYYFVKQKKSVSPVLPEQTTPVSPQTQSSVPADWKTYRNEKYGFEFKYPPTFVVDTTKYRYLSGLPQSGIFHILIYDSSKEPSFRHCGASDCTNVPFEYTGISVDVFSKGGLNKIELSAQDKNCGTSNITVGKTPTTLYCQGTLIGPYGFAVYKTEKFDYYFEPENVAIDKNLSDQIFSTFNFFSPTASAGVSIPSDWKTYRNEKYGFEFKYPNQFYVYSEKPADTESGNVVFSVVLDDIQFKGADRFRAFTTIGVYKKSTIENFLSTLVDNMTGKKVNILQKEKISDNPLTYKINTSDSQFNNIVVINGNMLVYIFSGSGPTAEQILSTFKFTK